MDGSKDVFANVFAVGVDAGTHGVAEFEVDVDAADVNATSEQAGVFLVRCGC